MSIINLISNPKHIPNIHANGSAIALIPCKIVDCSVVSAVKVYTDQLTICIHNWRTGVATGGVHIIQYIDRNRSQVFLEVRTEVFIEISSLDFLRIVKFGQ